MNPINKALSDIKFRIPKQILDKAFITPRVYSGFSDNSPTSIDFRIRQEVIEPRVLVDCNLVGGVTVTIPLLGVVPEYLPEYKVVWRIPFKLTQNRRITKVLSLIYGRGGVPTHTNMYNLGGSVYSDAASGLLASHMPIPRVSNAEMDLIGENTILAHMHVPPSPHLYLRCVVENDDEMHNLPQTSIPKFCKLVELAVKAYIYNKLIISMDEAFLQGGQTLGKFLSVVEEYADSNTLYDEYLEETWRKIALFSDTMANKRHLKFVAGGRY